MATATTFDDAVISLLQRSYPDAGAAADSDAVKLSSAIFKNTIYTEAEKAEIVQWQITASHIGNGSEDAAKQAERLSALNTHLSSRTTVLGAKPSVADVALYVKLAPVVAKWSAEERTGEQGYHHIVRFVDFVQNAPVFGLKVDAADKVAVDVNDVKFAIKPIDAKAEKERKKKEKEAAAAAAKGQTAAPAAENAADKKSKKEKKADNNNNNNKDGDAAAAAAATAPKEQKKEKKQKQPKQQPAKPAEKPLSPSLIDLRVGHILKAERHPNADSLYVSTIAVGDAPGTDNTHEYEGQVVRTVCSGLNGLIPLEEMQGRKIVAVCNLKPVTMRGIKSCAMVLAASPREEEGGDGHKGPVELVNPPPASAAGERVFFDGWQGDPEPVLNPKKKVWETLQPGFTTTQDLAVGFEVGDVPQLAGEGESKKSGVGLLKTKDGVCTVKSLQGATVR
ncbi:hypothetical protein JOL62DRAFT_505446 [Phyllosticta paracitricarpa]|uniref:tRNA-binding domain-containing protein n=1 Tax=Phyllosticta paracitricarpa TaxID=2016321 RepID=A0ABR1N4M4_9PEZI